jgi:hypothetical protein
MRIVRWGACSTYGGEVRGTQGLRWGSLKERNHLEDPCVCGRIILRWIFRKCDGGMDWIKLVRDRNRCQALVNAILNFRFLKMLGIS